MNVKEQLLELADPKYQQFSSRLLPGVDHLLGVRLPQLRKMAKQLAKEEGEVFLSQNDDIYFEEIMLKGMVIGYLKAPAEEILVHVKQFVPLISNWSVCDSFCSGLKLTKQNQALFWPMLISYLQSDSEFEVRFALVMMLNYYVDNVYIERVLFSCEQVRHDGYYVKMAVAWLLSVSYQKYPQLTLRFLEETTLDTFTYNKALQKISESLKSDEQTKILMNELRRS